MAFDLSPGRGAVLVTKHATYHEDAMREAALMKYLKQHLQSWVEFARKGGHTWCIIPILVTGVSLTREFAMLAYPDNQTRLECKFSEATVPGIASTPASAWGSWRTQGLAYTSCGPHPTRESHSSPSENPALGSGIPDEYTQCVFIRYYVGKISRFPIPAGAGPRLESSLKFRSWGGVFGGGRVQGGVAGPYQPPRRDHRDDDSSEEVRPKYLTAPTIIHEMDKE